MNSSKPHQARGFTLIELLTVIAIIGILVAIIVPTTSAVKTAAKKSQSKSQFNQWAQAMTLFKQEYGYYPDITNGANKIDPVKFAGALTARDLNGTPITVIADLHGNKKKMSFYTISSGDLNEARTALKDAFENTDIALLFDRNGNGQIDGHGAAESATSGISVGGLGASLTYPIRAPVVIFSAGKGTGGGDIVYSHK